MDTFRDLISIAGSQLDTKNFKMEQMKLSSNSEVTIVYLSPTLDYVVVRKLDEETTQYCQQLEGMLKDCDLIKAKKPFTVGMYVLVKKGDGFTRRGQIIYTDARFEKAIKIDFIDWKCQYFVSEDFLYEMPIKFMNIPILTHEVRVSQFDYIKSNSRHIPIAFNYLKEICCRVKFIYKVINGVPLIVREGCKTQLEDIIEELTARNIWPVVLQENSPTWIEIKKNEFPDILNYFKSDEKLTNIKVFNNELDGEDNVISDLSTYVNATVLDQSDLGSTYSTDENNSALINSDGDIHSLTRNKLKVIYYI